VKPLMQVDTEKLFRVSEAMIYTRKSTGQQTVRRWVNVPCHDGRTRAFDIMDRKVCETPFYGYILIIVKDIERENDEYLYDDYKVFRVQTSNGLCLDRDTEKDKINKRNWNRYTGQIYEGWEPYCQDLITHLESIS